MRTQTKLKLALAGVVAARTLIHPPLAKADTFCFNAQYCFANCAITHSAQLRSIITICTRNHTEEVYWHSHPSGCCTQHVE